MEAEGILLTRGRSKGREAAAVNPHHIESAAARSHSHGFGALNLMEQEWKLIFYQGTKQRAYMCICSATLTHNARVRGIVGLVDIRH